MKKVTKEYAENLADLLLEKFTNISNSEGNVSISLENSTSLTREALVKTILENDNIYVPFKRTIQFDNLQDETVKSICKPVGAITMTETFNKGFSAEELLNTNLANLNVHCEGINSKGFVSYGSTSIDQIESANSGKYYAVTYTGKGTDGTDFYANAIYNSNDPTQKEYYISKTGSNTSTKTGIEKTNIVSSKGKSININSSGYSTTKPLAIDGSEYLWNHYEGISEDSSNGKTYSWEDSIKETSGRIITNAICKYSNSEYAGTPVEFLVNDFSTGSTYKEENGVIKCANGSLSIVCKYNSKGNVVLEKPTFSKKESSTIVATNLNNIDSNCIAIVSVSTNTVTNSEEVVITPNYATLKKAGDVSKIVETLKKWNIGSSSSKSSLLGNNIWINTSNGSNCFTPEGKYVVNNYISLTDYLSK